MYIVLEGLNKDDEKIISKIPEEKLITILGNKKDLIDSKKVNKNIYLTLF